MPFRAPLHQMLHDKPQQFFWIFAFFHLVLWTLLPTLVSPNAPLDVIEGYAWGKEWLWGTYKHPPMQAWLLEIIAWTTGKSSWGHYLLSQIAVIVCFWAVWQTGRRIAGEQAGLIGALLLEGIIYYNYTSPEFNPNVIQLPFWALIGLWFHKAIKDNRWHDWAGLGLWTACGMYSKYSTVMFVFSLCIAVLLRPEARRRLRDYGPYFAFAIALLLFTPHLIWQWHHDFLPIQYARHRLIPQEGPPATISVLLLASHQFIALFFMGLLAIILYEKSADAQPLVGNTTRFDRVYLTCAAFGPFISTILVSIFFGLEIHDMWHTPYWNFIGLWAVVMMRPALSQTAVQKFAASWVLIFIVGLVAYFGSEYLHPYVKHTTKRTHFPGPQIAEQITKEWHDRFHTSLDFVIGDTWPAGNVAFYSDDRPSVFIDGDPLISSWINKDEFKAHGGVIVWCITCRVGDKMPARSEYLLQKYPSAEVQPQISMPRRTGAKVPPVLLGWAIVPPT